MGCHFLLQGIFLTQGSYLCLLRCRQVLLHHLSQQGSPYYINSYTMTLLLFLLFGILSSVLFIQFLLLNIKTKPYSLILVIVSYPSYANMLLNSVCVCVCMCACVYDSALKRFLNRHQHHKNKC